MDTKMYKIKKYEIAYNITWKLPIRNIYKLKGIGMQFGRFMD